MGPYFKIPSTAYRPQESDLVSDLTGSVGKDLLFKVTGNIIDRFDEAFFWNIQPEQRSPIKSTNDVRVLVSSVVPDIVSMTGIQPNRLPPAYATGDAQAQFLMETISQSVEVGSSKFVESLDPNLLSADDRFFFDELGIAAFKTAIESYGSHLRIEQLDRFALFLKSGIQYERGAITVAHEVAHVIQNDTGFLKDQSLAVYEGHADTVAYQWGLNRRRDKGLISFLGLYEIVKALALSSREVALADGAGLPYNIQEFLVRSSLGNQKPSHFKNPYHLGAAWMMCVVEEHGEDALRDMLVR